MTRCDVDAASLETTDAAGLLLTPMLVATLGSDPDLLREYPALLLTDMTKTLAAMDRACDIDDCKALGRAAHAARGVARGLRDGEPERLAHEIEMLARTGSVAHAREKVSRLRTLCATLQQSLTAAAATT